MSKPSIPDKNNPAALLRERGEVLRRIGERVLDEARLQALLARRK